MARAWSWSARRFGKAGVGHLRPELRQAESAERLRAARTYVCFSVHLCGPLYLCGENTLGTIYHRGTENHRDCTEKNSDRIVALLIPPLRLSLFHERVHAFTRVFSLHQFVQIKILNFRQH